MSRGEEEPQGRGSCSLPRADRGTGSLGRKGLSQQEHPSPQWLGAKESLEGRGGRTGPGVGDEGQGPTCVGEPLDPCLGPSCPPTSAQAGSFLPGWEIALAWNFSAGGMGECFWRRVQNLQLPTFLRQVQRRWTRIVQSPVGGEEETEDGQRRWLCQTPLPSSGATLGALSAVPRIGPWKMALLTPLQPRSLPVRTTARRRRESLTCAGGHFFPLQSRMAWGVGCGLLQSHSTMATPPRRTVYCSLRAFLCLLMVSFPFSAWAGEQLAYCFL